MSKLRAPAGLMLALLAVALFHIDPAGAQSARRVPPARPDVQVKRLSALTPVAEDALTRALRSGEIDAAQYALERATMLFRSRGVRARYGAGVRRPDPRQATFVLRDLALRLADLSPAERSRAERLLARPTDGAADPDGQGYSVSEATPVCTAAEFCIHYVGSTVDAPPPSDADADLVPDWVEAAAGVVAQVWASEVTAFGYRAPLADATSPNNGGDGRLDIYLANLGDEGIYGYCTTDDPNAADPNYQFLAFSAYCVIDNDFLETIFASSTPLQSMQVTVAHEFFHAVQFAYDAGEDLWLMEGTAAWVEDEVHDGINDNRQYLESSPLTLSRVPLDWGLNGFEYGAWISYRYLSERYGRGIVRSIWGRADGSPAALFGNQHSLQAVANTLAARGLAFRNVFNSFSRANRLTRRSYQEGAVYPPRPATRATWTLTGSRRIGSGSPRLLQLGAETIAFRPGRGIGRRARLELRLNLPSNWRGSEAGVLVFRPNGALISNRRITLNRYGNAILHVGFGRGRVARVELLLANASRRYACWQGTVWSCQGFPLDDNLVFSYRARAIS